MRSNATPSHQSSGALASPLHQPGVSPGSGEVVPGPREPPGVDVDGDHLAQPRLRVEYLHGLAPGSGACVQHSLSGFEVEQGHRELGGRILDRHGAVREPGQGLHPDRTGQHDRIRRDGVRGCLEALAPERFDVRGAASRAAAGAQGHRGPRPVRGEDRLPVVGPVRPQAVDEPAGVGVADLQVGGPFQGLEDRVAPGRGAPENRVREPAPPGRADQRAEPSRAPPREAECGCGGPGRDPAAARPRVAPPGAAGAGRAACRARGEGRAGAGRPRMRARAPGRVRGGRPPARAVPRPSR